MKNLALNKTMRDFDLPQCRLNCTTFGKLIFRKIIKTIDTRYHILKLKCTKFDLGGAPGVPYRSLPGFKGPACKGREERGKAERDTGKAWRQTKQNGDRPPTIFGLKSFNTSPKSALRVASPCAAGCESILNQK